MVANVGWVLGLVVLCSIFCGLYLLFKKLPGWPSLGVFVLSIPTYLTFTFFALMESGTCTGNIGTAIACINPALTVIYGILMTLVLIYMVLGIILIPLLLLCSLAITIFTLAGLGKRPRVDAWVVSSFILLTGLGAQSLLAFAVFTRPAWLTAL